MTKKELFEELYEKYQSLPRYKRKAAILKGMRPYFQDAEAAKIYVEVNLRRKVRNLISRRTRMVRKINLQEFGFFVTSTRLALTPVYLPYIDRINIDVKFFRNNAFHDLDMMVLKQGRIIVKNNKFV